MKVKAKFKCNSIQEFEHGKAAELNAIYDKEGENADFAKATPGGYMKINIDESTPAIDFFKLGGEYYLTFEKASEN